MSTNEYHQQADSFLAKHGIKFRATLSNTKVAPCGGEHETPGFYRNHYRVTLSRGNQGAKFSSRLTFDFWSSINDARDNRHPVAYDVLACISGDVHCPETFEDFCSEYGYEADSIRALQTFRHAKPFAKRLRAFFTAEELEGLAEIR